MHQAGPIANSIRFDSIRFVAIGFAFANGVEPS